MRTTLLLFTIMFSVFFTKGQQTINTCIPYENENICLITIDSVTFKNRITWENTPGVGTAGYIIYKETSSDIYDSIGYKGFNMASKFIDYTSSPEVHSDRYKICVVDSCGNKSQKSPYHQTIHLQVTQGFPTTIIILNWTKYFDESGVFVPSKYYIYRGTLPDNMSLLDSVSGSLNTYSDFNVFSNYYYGVGYKRQIPCHYNPTSTEIISNIAFKGISVYPNPMKEFTNIKWDTELGNNCTLTVFDVSGKMVFNENVINSFNYSISRENFKKGFYIIEVSGTKTYRCKLVVE
ncbi:MAG: T9SS type A sorting domain-containing protein [Bacteroidia bacterium]|nr:T9SS type A sorting domain-containing protein [Bacteroidia bacterium]